MNTMKRLLAVMMILGLLCSVCAVHAEDGGKFTTITLFPFSADMKSGVVGGYVGELMEKNYNIAVDVWAYSVEKKNAILSSRALPDVMYVDMESLATLIEGGLILNLEDYLDRLPMVTEKDYLTEALNFTRTYRSAGTGQLYAIPIRVGTRCGSYTITKNMMSINWKYYKSVGYPSFNDQWELLDVMETMLKANPVGEDGVTNYGTYLNAGSDSSYWGCMNQYFKWFGFEPAQLSYFLETDMIHGTYSSIFEEDSLYKEGLKWYNQAYRRGLMDPESINNDRQTQKAYVDNGHAMVPSGSLQGSTGTGYMSIYMPGEQIFQEKWNSKYGKDYVLVINAQSANIDAALRFVNMMADPDIFLQVKAGPIGEYLIQNEDRSLSISDRYLEETRNGVTKKLSTGEELTAWTSDWIIDDSNLTSFVDAEGNNRPIKPTDWPEVRAVVNDTQNQNEWRELTGYQYYIDQVMDAGNFFDVSVLDDVVNFASVPDDFMKLTQSAVNAEVIKASWQMVYANSDEEFEAIWKQMVSDCLELGAQDIIDWRLEDLKNALEIKLSLAE